MWMGIKCSSWVSISAPSTGRCYLDPLGYGTMNNILANCMVSRTLAVWLFAFAFSNAYKFFFLEHARRSVLIAWLAIALGAIIIVEQPGSSLLARHPRFQQLCDAHKAFKILRILFYSVIFCCILYHMFLFIAKYPNRPYLSAAPCTDLANMVLDGALSSSNTQANSAMVQFSGHCLLLEREDV